MNDVLLRIAELRYCHEILDSIQIDFCVGVGCWVLYPETEDHWIWDLIMKFRYQLVMLHIVFWVPLKLHLCDWCVVYTVYTTLYVL